MEGSIGIDLWKLKELYKGKVWSSEFRKSENPRQKLNNNTNVSF